MSKIQFLLILAIEPKIGLIVGKILHATSVWAIKDRDSWVENKLPRKEVTISTLDVGTIKVTASERGGIFDILPEAITVISCCYTIYRVYSIALEAEVNLLLLVIPSIIRLRFLVLKSKSIYFFKLESVQRFLFYFRLVVYSHRFQGLFPRFKYTIQFHS